MRSNFLAAASCALAFASAMLAAAPSQAAVVTWASTATSASTVDVDLTIRGVPPGVGLGAFDLSLFYNPSAWQVSSVTFGPYLGDIVAGEAITSVDLTTSGVAQLIEVSLLGLFDPQTLVDIQPASFSLGRVSFTALVPNAAPRFLLDNIQLSDAVGNPIEVPEPATGLLVVAGGLPYLLLRRRRKAAQAQ